MSNSTDCPKCHAESIDRVRRTWLDRLIGVQKRFRCYVCRHEFTVRTDSEQKNTKSA